MEIRLDRATPAPEWPPGVAVHTADLDADAPSVHTLLELAFRGNADDEKPDPFEPWLAWWMGDPEFDPASWFLAEEDGMLVGAALCWSSGFLKDLAVDPQHRRRGIGRCLLLHVFGEFRARGARAVSLKVDAANPTGAVRVYEAAGMRAVERLST